MTRRLVLALLLLALTFPFASSVDAFAPALQSTCTNNLIQPSGQPFRVGEPSSLNADGPVVVFVHGYTSSHTTWTGSNYAVRDACANGFRVAAVDLAGTGSIWNNGADLKNRLQAVASHFNVARVNIMAHSKGGLDTQTAIVHYGAYPLVQSYIAFGSPFGGTDLADHACSWYGWALWQCNDATWSMRTGYMSYVRSITDNRAENGYVRAYAARASKCDWYNPACAMISGSDDGVVPTWSAWANGRDNHISDRSDLRHGEVHQTQRYGSWLFSYLGRATNGSLGSNSLDAESGAGRIEGAPLVADEPDAPLLATSNYTLRGGQMAGRVAESIAVESGLSAVHFTYLTNGAARVVVTSPGGALYEARPQRSEPGDLLQGIFHVVTIEKPEAGQWQVAASSLDRRARPSGYLLRATYEGGLTVQLDTDLRVVHQPGATLPVNVSTSSPVASAALSGSLRSGQDNVRAADLGGALRGQSLALPRAAGTYNVDIRVTGTAADGTLFERTLVTSVAVASSDSREKPSEMK